MKFTQEIINAIKGFIISKVSSHPNDLTAAIVDHFEISRQTASKYINELINDEVIIKTGNGRFPNYKLKEHIIQFFKPLSQNLEEDILWREEVSRELTNIPQNIKSICQYGFTEMVNNVIDHSEGKNLHVKIVSDINRISISISDDGIGIFKKIQKDLNLEDPKHSILELAKGKFTSDPENHTGEGIFFTSRMFDTFIILSQELRFIANSETNDYLFEEKNIYEGTFVLMIISKQSTRDVKKVFDQYADPEKIPGFHKTIVPVRLMEYEGESLISRSQAKRLINRFDHFLEVILDFDGVTFIGQAFADQIFRVFSNTHPNVNLIAVKASESVQNMIDYVKANNQNTKESIHNKSNAPDT